MLNGKFTHISFSFLEERIPWLTIVPILLTVLSTVVGLIPFLFDGASNPFWYSYAVGSMGGLLFSLIALVFALPVFVILNIEN